MGEGGGSSREPTEVTRREWKKGNVMGESHQTESRPDRKSGMVWIMWGEVDVVVKTTESGVMWYIESVRVLAVRRGRGQWKRGGR